MDIFLSLDGTCQIINVEPIYQGSNAVTDIIVQSYLPNTTAMELFFILPDQSKVGPFVMTPIFPTPVTDGLNYWSWTLIQGVTALSGQVQVTINAISGAQPDLIYGTQNTTSFSCGFQVTPGILPNIPSWPPSQDQWELILQYLQLALVSVEDVYQTLNPLQFEASAVTLASTDQAYVNLELIYDGTLIKYWSSLTNSWVQVNPDPDPQTANPTLWLYNFIFGLPRSNVPGPVGPSVAAGAQIVLFDDFQWQGSQAPFTFEIPNSVHNLGETPNIGAFIFERTNNGQLNVAQYQDYSVSDLGLVTLTSNIKFNGQVMLVAGVVQNSSGGATNTAQLLVSTPALESLSGNASTQKAVNEENKAEIENLENDITDINDELENKVSVIKTTLSGVDIDLLPLITDGIVYYSNVNNFVVISADGITVQGNTVQMSTALGNNFIIESLYAETTSLPANQVALVSRYYDKVNLVWSSWTSAPVDTATLNISNPTDEAINGTDGKQNLVNEGFKSAINSNSAQIAQLVQTIANLTPGSIKFSATGTANTTPTQPNLTVIDATDNPNAIDFNPVVGTPKTGVLMGVAGRYIGQASVSFNNVTPSRVINVDVYVNGVLRYLRQVTVDNQDYEFTASNIIDITANDLTDPGSVGGKALITYRIYTNASTVNYTITTLLTLSSTTSETSSNTDKINLTSPSTESMSGTAITQQEANQEFKTAINTEITNRANADTNLQNQINTRLQQQVLRNANTGQNVTTFLANKTTQFDSSTLVVNLILLGFANGAITLSPYQLNNVNDNSWLDYSVYTQNTANYFVFSIQKVGTNVNFRVTYSANSGNIIVYIKQLFTS